MKEKTMTNREKAIVMAYTGVAMLTGDKLNVFYEYLYDLFKCPVYTYEIGYLADEIKEKAKDDFMKLCDESKDIDLSKLVECKDCMFCYDGWCYRPVAVGENDFCSNGRKNKR